MVKIILVKNHDFDDNDNINDNTQHAIKHAMCWYGKNDRR